MIDTAEIRARHEPVINGLGNRYCAKCDASSPCDAIRLCDALDKSRIFNDAKSDFLRGSENNVERLLSECDNLFAKVTEQAAEIERLNHEINNMWMR